MPLVVLLACGGSDVPTSPALPSAPPAPATPAPSLRALAQGRGLHIGIGTAVGSHFGRPDADGVRYDAVLKREFNVLTPENDLKFASVQPARGVFAFARADAMVAFAQLNAMRVRGHTLVWHSTLPGWLTSGTWTRAEGVALLDAHISAVVGHYRGKLAAWDVVNEALNADGSPRTTFWSSLIGPGYVEQAFRSAAAADPDVPLFYNDYNIETFGPKSDAALAMLADLRGRGVPVHGVGFQSHFVAGQTPGRAALVANMNRFAALGLRIQITELDVRMAVPPTPAMLQAQARDYVEVVSACLEVPACDMVVTWGFTDLASWVPSFFPGLGAALLFDAGFQPKPAYDALLDLLSRW